MAWTLEDDSHSEIIEEIERGRDRSAAIVGASYLEERLTATLRQGLQQDDEVASRMFKGHGPLATFSAKIEIGYLLGAYRAHTRKKMHTVREIRNAFAHSSTKITFKTQRIKDLCKNLSGPVRKSKFDLSPQEIRLVVQAKEVDNTWKNSVLSDAIYRGRDTPRNRYIICLKENLLHLYLVRIALAEFEKLAQLDPQNRHRYLRWPFLGVTEGDLRTTKKSGTSRGKYQGPPKASSGSGS